MVIMFYQAANGRLHLSKRDTLEEAEQDVNSNDGTVLSKFEGDENDKEFRKEVVEYAKSLGFKKMYSSAH
jgi:hypothetical protein